MNTKRKAFIVSILVLCSVLVGAVYAMQGQGKGGGNKGGGGGDPSTTPIFVRFVDRLGDNIQSDGGGDYIDGLEEVQAVLDQSGDLHLDTAFRTKEPLRKVFLDFRERVAEGTDSNALPFLSATIDVFISTSTCPKQDRLRAMVEGENLHCNLNFNFADLADSGRQWFIRFAPADYPGTEQVLVTCLVGNPCSRWVIHGNDGHNIAKLLSATTRGRLILADHGNFRLPTELTITLK